MDTGPVPAITMPLVATVVMGAPVALAWLVLATLARADRSTRTDLIGGFGCGLLAAGAATAVGAAAHWSVGMTEPERLTVYAPIVEETLKALGIVAALGFASLARATRQPLDLRRCLVVTVAVAAAFATGENLGHLGALLLTEGGAPAGEEVGEALRVRAVLPPLAHLAETWAAGAALWLASRCRGRYPRAAVLLLGVGAASGVHALWNAAALWWWPNPWPLVAILAGALGGAAAGHAAMSARQRREYRLAQARSALAATAEQRQPAIRA